MCEYFCIGFIDLLLKRKSYLECSIVFTKWIKKKKKKLMLEYFQLLET